MQISTKNGIKERKMQNKSSLDSNRTDFNAKIAKTVVGLVPYAGGVLAELVDSIIPHQRMDRLVKFCKELDDRILKIENKNIHELFQNEEFVDLIEESFVQASRATTDERREYIVFIVVNGITDETVNYQDSKYLLRLLSELNDIEVIWLRFYLDPTLAGDTEYRKLHENVLTRVSSYKGADKETINKASIQKSYKEHLERLKLIKGNIRFDNKTNLPEFDRITGLPKVTYHQLTALGKMLLEHIGLLNDNDKE